MFWFETEISVSRAFNCASPKISHHVPHAIASAGIAGLQGTPLVGSTGDNSLYAAGEFRPVIHQQLER
jgi:hypothetical protein